MLGRKTYTRDEIDRARAVVDEHLGTYRALAEAADATDAAGDAKPSGTLAAYEPVAHTRMVLVLDRLFVHRVRVVSGKDTNPLTEVELLAESLLVGDVLLPSKVIKYDAARSVLGLAPGDRITMDAAGFERLATAFLDEIERRCLEA